MSIQRTFHLIPIWRLIRTEPFVPILILGCATSQTASGWLKESPPQWKCCLAWRPPLDICWGGAHHPSSLQHTFFRTPVILNAGFPFGQLLCGTDFCASRSDPQACTINLAPQLGRLEPSGLQLPLRPRTGCGNVLWPKTWTQGQLHIIIYKLNGMGPFMLSQKFSDALKIPLNIACAILNGQVKSNDRLHELKWRPPAWEMLIQESWIETQSPDLPIAFSRQWLGIFSLAAEKGGQIYILQSGQSWWIFPLISKSHFLVQCSENAVEMLKLPSHWMGVAKDPPNPWKV